MPCVNFSGSSAISYRTVFRTRPEALSDVGPAINGDQPHIDTDPEDAALTTPARQIDAEQSAIEDSRGRATREASDLGHQDDGEGFD